MESKKYDKLVNKTKRKQTHRYREQTSGYQWREGSGVEQYRGRGKKGYYGIIWNQVCETSENCKAI